MEKREVSKIMTQEYNFVDDLLSELLDKAIRNNAISKRNLIEGLTDIRIQLVTRYMESTSNMWKMK